MDPVRAAFPALSMAEVSWYSVSTAACYIHYFFLLQSEHGLPFLCGKSDSQQVYVPEMEVEP